MMAKQKADDEAVLHVATELFRRNGYRGTTMSAVGRACGLLKGSLYNHFASKEDLAIAAMSHVAGYFKEHIFSTALIPNLAPAKKLSQMSMATLRYFESVDGGCLLGNLALDSMDSVPDYQQIIANFFQEWISAYTDIYVSAGYDSEESSCKAKDAVVRIQGALLLQKVLPNQKPLQCAIFSIISSM